MDAQNVKVLEEKGVHLERNSQNLLAVVADTMFSGS